MNNIINMSTHRARKKYEELCPEGKLVFTFMETTDSEMEKNIGKRGKFISPTCRMQESPFTIIGVQRMWGYNENGDYVHTIKGYRVMFDGGDRFGSPANPKEIVIFD